MIWVLSGLKEHVFFSFRLVVLDYKDVSYSEFSTVGVAHDDAASRAPG